MMEGPIAMPHFSNVHRCTDPGLTQVDVAAYIPFGQTDPDDYDRVLGINTKGPFLVTRAVGNVMQEQEPVQVNLGRHGTRDGGRGSIVNVSSGMALVAVPAKAPYTTSKHALTGVTKAAGMDLPPSM
jgi:NAD(P)-dependent dehydrogenase (short-subunit alcohol dehydrogenase family)